MFCFVSQYLVFKGTRGNSDHQSLKATVDVTNEVESLLQEIAQLSPLLKKITDQGKAYMYPE